MALVYRSNRRSFDWFIIFSVEESQEGVRKMKLSEYLYKKMILDHWKVREIDIQHWISHWCADEYEPQPAYRIGTWLLGKKKK